MIFNFKLLAKLLKPKPRTAFYTSDGGHLAPYPNMTDSELHEFEVDFKIKERTFPNGIAGRKK